MSKGQAGDLVRPWAGVDGADIARAAEFLIDSNGKIPWANLTEDYRVRIQNRCKRRSMAGRRIPAAKREAGGT